MSLLDTSHLVPLPTPSSEFISKQNKMQATRTTVILVALPQHHQLPTAGAANALKCTHPLCSQLPPTGALRHTPLSSQPPWQRCGQSRMGAIKPPPKKDSRRHMHHLDLRRPCRRHPREQSRVLPRGTMAERDGRCSLARGGGHTRARLTACC